MCLCVCVCVWVTQSCLTLCSPMDCSTPGSSVHGISSARILEWVAILFFSKGSSQPRDQILHLLHWQADSLPVEPPGKPINPPVKWSDVAQSCPTLCNPYQAPPSIFAIPTRLLPPWDSPGKSTGVGCHFLLQGIFPTQGSNPGFPHSRQML